MNTQHLRIVGAVLRKDILSNAWLMAGAVIALAVATAASTISPPASRAIGGLAALIMALLTISVARADRVGGGDTVLEERADRARVKPLDVVAFEEGIHDQLPVCLHVMGAAAEEVLAGEIEGLEILSECFGLREIG